MSREGRERRGERRERRGDRRADRRGDRREDRRHDRRDRRERMEHLQRKIARLERRLGMPPSGRPMPTPFGPQPQPYQQWAQPHYNPPRQGDRYPPQAREPGGGPYPRGERGRRDRDMDRDRRGRRERRRQERHDRYYGRQPRPYTGAYAYPYASREFRENLGRAVLPVGVGGFAQPGMPGAPAQSMPRGQFPPEQDPPGQTNHPVFGTFQYQAGQPGWPNGNPQPLPAPLFTPFGGRRHRRAA